MMNITNHAKLRYVQRIHGIIDERESRHFLAQNDSMVSECVQKMLTHSAHIWSGRIGSNKIGHFHLQDDNVLVMDESRTSIVTIYKCDFGFPVVINRQTIKSLSSEIRKIQEKMEKHNSRMGAEASKREVEIENIDVQIRAKQSELDLLYERRKQTEGEIGTLKQETNRLSAEIDTIATMLFNSIDFKKDMLGNKYSAG